LHVHPVHSLWVRPWLWIPSLWCGSVFWSGVMRFWIWIRIL